MAGPNETDMQPEPENKSVAQPADEVACMQCTSGARSPLLIPVIAVAIVVAMFVRTLAPNTADSENGAAYNLDAAATLPVSSEGRVKPLDSVARHSLLLISNKQSPRVDDEKLNPMAWYLGAVARQEQTMDLAIVRIDHPDLKALFGTYDDARKLFSLTELRPKMAELEQLSDLARQKPAKFRDAYDKQVLELDLKLREYAMLMRLDKPFVIPPDEAHPDWRPIAEAVSHQHAGETHGPAPAVIAYTGILSAYQSDDPETFNVEVAAYLSDLNKEHPGVMRKARFEVFYNQFHAFTLAASLYVLTFIVGWASFLFARDSGWGKGFLRAALLTAAVALLVHTFGLSARTWLQGRPPVTNLYSSAVFVGWGCVVLALIIEKFMRNGLLTVTASLIGFITLIVAHHLQDGDTMGMMQAVLDSNFWLATHVIAVTIGYSATFLAGIIAILAILLGVFTRAIDKPLFKDLGRSVYGVICFALLFSFVGTVLGGIWADQSWGRFWGWDPKENGAILIVLMNAIILHARWGGLAKERGIFAMAVFGNIVTSWSWFGTNMLGVGLHSYGFMDSAIFWLLLFVATQLLFIAIGMIPLRHWRSVRGWAQDTSPLPKKTMGEKGSGTKGPMDQGLAIDGSLGK